MPKPRTRKPKDKKEAALKDKMKVLKKQGKTTEFINGYCRGWRKLDASAVIIIT